MKYVRVLRVLQMQLFNDDDDDDAAAAADDDDDDDDDDGDAFHVGF